MDIRKFREKAGLSREELAVKIGVSVTTVYKWERKKDRANPHKTFERQLRKILNIQEK